MVRALLKVHLVMVEVLMDQTLTLDVNLGKPCAVETGLLSVSTNPMIACINSNQFVPQP